MKRITTIIKCIYLSLGLILVSTIGNAQANRMDSATLHAQMELTNIAYASDAYDNKQFDISVIVSSGVAADTISGTCSIMGNNYKCVFDSVEQIQNNYINLEMHTDGKVFVISKPVPFNKQFFKGNIDESLLQQMNVDSMIITGSGANKKLIFTFLPESEYKSYYIIYDSTTYRVSEVFVQTKIIDDLGNYSTTNFASSNTVLQNFISITPGTVLFDTSPYVFVESGTVFQKQAAYFDYQIIDLVNE